MVKIRLMRIGAKKRPFYRVVAVDERSKRTGAYLELLGTYNPLTTPHDVILKQDRIDFWTKQGAQMSVGFLRVIGKAPKRAPRKPKKEPAVKPEVTPAPEATPVETPTEVPQEETTPVVEQAAQTPEEPAVEETKSKEATNEVAEETSEAEKEESK